MAESRSKMDPAIQISILALFISLFSCVQQSRQNELSLAALNQSQKQFIDSQKSSLLQFVATQKSSQEQFVVTQKSSQAQFAMTQKLSQEQFARSLEASLDDLHLSHDPYLQFERHGMIFLERSVDGGVQRAGLSKNQFSEVDSNSLPLIENLGRGPAFNVKLIWRINGLDDRSETETEYLPPEQNYRGEEGDIRIDWLPKMITDDRKQQIRSLAGSVTLKCLDLNREQKEFSMKVRITTDYQASRPFVRYEFTDWVCESCRPIVPSGYRHEVSPYPARQRGAPEPPEPPPAK